MNVLSLFDSTPQQSYTFTCTYVSTVQLKDTMKILKEKGKKEPATLCDHRPQHKDNCLFT